MDAWLHTKQVEDRVARAAKLLALAETPVEIAAQVQDNVHELATKNAELQTKLTAVEHEQKKKDAKL